MAKGIQVNLVKPGDLFRFYPISFTDYCELDYSRFSRLLERDDIPENDKQPLTGLALTPSMNYRRSFRIIFSSLLSGRISYIQFELSELERCHFFSDQRGHFFTTCYTSNRDPSFDHKTSIGELVPLYYVIERIL